MMRIAAVHLAALLLLVCLGTSCARTVYTNLHPQLPAPSVEPDHVDRSKPRSWRHFFLFGWAPGELVIDARQQCDGAEHVERIETRQSFLQGLVYQFAGYYVNIYAPYTGRVVCDHSRMKR